MSRIKGSRQRGRATATKIRTRNRHLEAMQLRLQGFTWTEIADKLDYANEAGPRNAVNRRLQKIEFEAVDEYRKIHLLRLERLYRIADSEIYYKDKDGVRRVNLWAMDRCQSILAQEAQLLGLNAPTQIEMSVDWREELREQGIDDSELFNQLVAAVAAQSVSD